MKIPPEDETTRKLSDLATAQFRMERVHEYCMFAENNKLPNEEIILLSPPELTVEIRKSLEILGHKDLYASPNPHNELFGYKFVTTNAVTCLTITYSRPIRIHSVEEKRL